MTLPSLLFGVLLSTLIGLFFHLWKGGSIAKLLYYLVMSWIGFWVGHFFGDSLGWKILDLGPLHLGMGILGSILLSYFGYWLGLVRVRNAKS